MIGLFSEGWISAVLTTQITETKVTLRQAQDDFVQGIENYNSLKTNLSVTLRGVEV